MTLLGLPGKLFSQTICNYELLREFDIKWMQSYFANTYIYIYKTKFNVNEESAEELGALGMSLIHLLSYDIVMLMNKYLILLIEIRAWQYF